MSLTRERLLAAVTLLIPLSACSNLPAVRNECHSVKYVRDNSQRLDGSEISVCGYLRYEFEDKNLYSSRKAAANSSDKYCIAVGRRAEAKVDLSALNGKSVRIHGVVTAKACPEGAVCAAACSQTGIAAMRIDAE
jgi:hypothetical protein